MNSELQNSQEADEPLETTTHSDANEASSNLEIPTAPDLSVPFRPDNLKECNQRIQAFFDQFAPARHVWREKNLGYYLELERQYKLAIPEQSSVLEVGCGMGNLLSALSPSTGLGLDISPAVIDRAKQKFSGHSNLRFQATSIETWDPKGETFDAIILSDLVGFLYDIESVLDHLKKACHPRTRIIMNFHSRLWQPIFSAAEFLGLKARQPILNWVTVEDMDGFLKLCDYEVIRSYQRVQLPKQIPLLGRFFNRFLPPFRPFRWFCISNFIIARPVFKPQEKPLTVSVVCPCRNEAGNIDSIVRRLPQMGAHTELIFVEGNSTDTTQAACLAAKEKFPDVDISVHQQSGIGKGDAVRLGFDKAKGDVLMILDADMTVPPEDLQHFYDVLIGGRVEFINGSRLVYPMEAEAMRFLNLCANKFFGLTFSFLIEQSIKDTLCGTKVLLKTDYEKIARNRSYFGALDPFGDFDLLFGAAKLNLKIQDLPIRYRDRTYGTTNISRFRHGILLFRMCWLAFKRLKCQ